MQMNHVSNARPHFCVSFVDLLTWPYVWVLWHELGVNSLVAFFPYSATLCVDIKIHTAKCMLGWDIKMIDSELAGQRGG